MPPQAQQLAFIPQVPTSTKRSRQRERAPAPVQVYKQIVGRWPHKSTWPTIDQAVRNGHPEHTSDDMTRWANTVRSWLAVGYNPLNVKGMLDCFEREILPDPARRATVTTEPAGYAAIREWTAQQEAR